jgi:endonuclease YncB( thermonuclease family)
MQDFGNKAKPVLSELIFGKTVTVQKVGTDRYRRTIASIQIDGKDVVTEMVKAGFAWE